MMNIIIIFYFDIILGILITAPNILFYSKHKYNYLLMVPNEIYDKIILQRKLLLFNKKNKTVNSPLIFFYNHAQ